MLHLASWNVNGLQAAQPAVLSWLADAKPDVLCLQETKLQPHQINLDLRHPQGYQSYWAHAAQAGYSGLAIYSRLPIQQTRVGLGQERYDIEGRLLQLELEAFHLLNVYVPSGASSRSKWFYKMAFLYALLEYVQTLQVEGKPIVLCGDFNMAHSELDVARPIRVAGFMAEERDWISELSECGFVDSYRHLHPEEHGYSWWSNRAGLRERNQGWRLDYAFISRDLTPHLHAASLHSEVKGSDHCPISLKLDL
jgi:exodeoxyribonuclease-3